MRFFAYAQNDICFFLVILRNDSDEESNCNFLEILRYAQNDICFFLVILRNDSDEESNCNFLEILRYAQNDISTVTLSANEGSA